MSAQPSRERAVVRVSRSGVPSQRGSSLIADGRERLLLGELHLLRRRLEGTLDGISVLLRETDRVEAWEDVERAARIALRGLACAVAAAPPLAADASRSNLLTVDRLLIDPGSHRQWWGEAEFELSPLLHRLLACLAAEPYRVFSREELLREVWGPRSTTQASAVPATIMRLRRVLTVAGVPPERVVTHAGIGWSLLAGRHS